jgi:hypothetical protein
MKITATNTVGATDTVESVTITHSDDHGGAIIRHGYINDKSISVINTCLNDGLSFIVRVK